jgi:hypothetical protein
MIADAARRLLCLPRSQRVHVPGDKPHYILNRRPDTNEWGVAVLHGARQIDWLTPEEARRQAGTLIELARLAANPGALPRESFG